MGQEIDRMETNEILSFRELAKLLNISTNKLTRLTKQGLPCVLLGGDRRVFLRSSVLEWLRDREE
jgi:predicted DNA-binding transcriptional regulator AlpA